MYRSKHHYQQRDKHHYDPSAMNEFGRHQDDENEESGDGANAIDDD